MLAELVAKSLVTAEVSPIGTRYQMLETLRHYGQERLNALGEGPDIRRRHAHWARSLVLQAAPGFKGRDERVSGDVVRAELDNLRVAVGWAITNVDAEIAFGIIGPLEDYMILRLDFEVAAWAEQVLAVPEWADHPRRQLALGLVAYAAWARGEHDRALALGQEALAIERRLGVVPSWAAWQSIGDAAWFRGRTDEALAHYGRWVDRARAVGDDFNLSSALAHLAVAGSFLDGWGAAGSLADEALDLARRCGSPYLIALTLYAKSEVVIDDDPATALRLVEEGAAIGRDSGNRFAYGLCLTTLASLTGRHGEPVEALRQYRLAMENWRAAGNWTNQRILLRNLAELTARIGQEELTARLLGALKASGEMLGADIGPEGQRLADAVELARRALGGDRYDELAREGGRTAPLVLVRDTIELLDRLTTSGEAAATAPTPSAATAVSNGAAMSNGSGRGRAGSRRGKRRWSRS